MFDGRLPSPAPTPLPLATEASAPTEASDEPRGARQDCTPPFPSTAPDNHRLVIEAGDGRRVEIEAADELVLRCGEASITLTRDGRITICGTYVETRARGTNRIRGGSVQIN
jgi:hypothetical protein